MKRLLLFVLFLTFALVGCQGGAGGGDTSASPFAGRWAGTWNSAALSQNGSAEVTIATNGTLTGTIHNNQSGSNGTLSGSTSNSGQVSGSAQYPGEQAITIRGTISINEEGHLVGNLVQTINNTNYDQSFDLTFQ